MVDGKVDKIESRDEIDLHVGKLDGQEVGQAKDGRMEDEVEIIAHRLKEILKETK